MTRTEAYKKLAVIKALDKAGERALAADLERELTLSFLRDALFSSSVDDEIARMLVGAMECAPNRYTPPATADCG